MLPETVLPPVVGDAAPATLTTDIAVGVVLAVVIFGLYYKLVLLRAKHGHARDATSENGSSRRDTGN